MRLRYERINYAAIRCRVQAQQLMYLNLEVFLGDILQCRGKQ